MARFLQDLKLFWATLEPFRTSSSEYSLVRFKDNFLKDLKLLHFQIIESCLGLVLKQHLEIFRAVCPTEY
jgi:hypothetical protein